MTDRRHTEAKVRWARNTLHDVLNEGLPDSRQVPKDSADMDIDYDPRWGTVEAIATVRVRGRKVRITLTEVPPE